MKRNCYKITIWIYSFLLIINILLSVKMPVEASTINTDGTALETLSGDAWYINSSDYYFLDMEETEWNEVSYVILHHICNVFFNLIKKIGKVTTVLFYHCMDFDIVNLFKTEIKLIQTALNASIFKPLFILGFCGSAVIIAKNLWKRNLMGAYGEIIKAIGIWVLAFLVVTQSSTVLSGATNLTKSISAHILLSVQNNGGNGNTNLSSYAAETAGVLWVDLVHRPWMYVEFGAEVGSISHDTITQLLTPEFANGTEARIDFVENYPGNAFSKERIFEKLGFMVLYIFPLLIRSGIFMVMAVLMLGYQVFSVFYVLAAPLILLLAMLPGYERTVSAWLKKMLELQFGILVLSMAMGLLIMIDKLLYMFCSVRWGWVVVCFVETIIDIIIVVKHKDILEMMGNIRQKATSSGYVKGIMGKTHTNTAIATVSTAKKAFELATNDVSAGRMVMHHYESKHKERQNRRAERKANHQTILKGEDSKGGSSGESIETEVKRPIMTSMNKNEMDTYEMQNNVLHVPYYASQNLSAPHIEQKRPRLEDWSVIRVEAVNGRLERIEEPKRELKVQYVQEQRIDKRQDMHMEAVGSMGGGVVRADVRGGVATQERTGQRPRLDKKQEQ